MIAKGGKGTVNLKYCKHFEQVLNKENSMDIKGEIKRGKRGKFAPLILTILLILFLFSAVAKATCTYSISPTSQSFSSNGGTGSISWTSQSGCGWTVTENLDWVTIISGESGVGSGTVTYSVSANNTGYPRRGAITIGNETFTIRQAKSVFNDVPDPNNWSYNSIYAIYTEGITVGCGNSNYCPNASVTRGQMAAFIIRAKYGENFTYTKTPYFSDVPSTHLFFKYVQKLRDDGITSVSGIYDVDNYVTRGQMAAFIIRAKYGEDFTYTQTPYFSDVPSTHLFFKYVQKLKDDGITAVTGTYNVDSVVTREQMAAFLFRGFLIGVSLTKSCQNAIINTDSNGGVTGRFTTGSLKTVIFSATPQGGGAEARIQIEGTSQEVRVKIYSEERGEITWNGVTIDGYGILTPQETEALNDLSLNELGTALACISLEMGCKSNGASSSALAALLMPWQMLLKYTTSDPEGSVRRMAEQSTCNYFNFSDSNNLPTSILLSDEVQIPVVFGYFPFNAEGAAEVAAEVAAGNSGSSTRPQIQMVTTNEYGPKGAMCRGACGPDCIRTNCNCTEEWRCEKDTTTGENTGYRELWHIFYNCGTHQGCRLHDDCYDQCDRDFSGWRAFVCKHCSNPDRCDNIYFCDRDCLIDYGYSNCLSWMLGYGPFDPERETFEYSKMFVLNRIECPSHCTYSISPTSASFTSEGGTGFVMIHTNFNDCPWTAISNENWITITSDTSGSGGGPVTYSVSTNTGTSQRTGRMTIASQSFTVSQSGTSCTYSILPTSQSFGASGGAGSVSVTAPIGCNWIATSYESWITITSGSSGSGSGPVNYSVSANTDTGQRTGRMSIAGQIFTVIESGVSCSYSISPTNQSFGSSGGSGSVSVTTQSGCPWTASSNANWIMITSGSSGSGSEPVNYSVSANTGTSSRTGTTTIAGQTFTVSQSGVSCTYSISPTSQSFDSSGGTGGVSVTTQSGCLWTATSHDGWITITSGSTGSGSGPVNYSVSANTDTSSRTGTMAIAGKIFNVTQSGSSSGFVITTTSLPSESNDWPTAYAVTVWAIGGTAPCTWTVTGLPETFSFSMIENASTHIIMCDGVLIFGFPGNGNPPVGNYPITITGMDCTGQVATKTLTLTITP